MYRRVMLTTDGSEIALRALPHAARLVDGEGTVVLVAVVRPAEEVRLTGRSTGWVDMGPSLSATEIEQIIENERSTAAQHLDEARAALEHAGVKHVETRVVEGSPGPAIVESAGSLDCEVVVIATHGRSGLDRLLLGSVADHVTKHAPVPVLLVNARPAARA